MDGWRVGVDGIMIIQSKMNGCIHVIEVIEHAYRPVASEFPILGISIPFTL